MFSRRGFQKGIGGVQEVSDECHGLNVCVSPKRLCCNPNAQCDGIGKC